MNYYTYIYLDPRKMGNYQYDDLIFKYEPFYVGKGMRDRKYDHLNSAIKGKDLGNPHKFYKILKILKVNKRPIILQE